MWPSTRRRQRRHNNNHTNNHNRNKNATAAVVGTEAKAIENIAKNSKTFNYPKEGFITRIEHSLIYNMISEPGVYPEDVVLKQITEEDFESYLFVAAAVTATAVGNSTTNTNTNNNDVDDDDDHVVSYAQLSAILALSLQKYPPPREEYEDQQSQHSVPQKLCKAVLQCVVKYATNHDLDRQVEVQELLKPVETSFVKRNDAAQLKNALPFYIGYTATLLTANPIPMLVGVTIMGATGDSMVKEQRNMISIAKQTSRAADVETTGLLDESDDF